MKTYTLTPNTISINFPDDHESSVLEIGGVTNISITKTQVVQPAPTSTSTPAPGALPSTQFAFGQPVQIPRPWRHVYSQLQAFNGDDSLMIVYNIDLGSYGILNTKTLQLDVKFPSYVQSPRWFRDGIVYVHRSENSVVDVRNDGSVVKYKHPNPLSESITYEDITGDVITCFDKTTRKLLDIHLVTGVRTDWPAFSSAMGTDVDWATNYYGTRCAMMRGTSKGLYHHTGTGWVRSTDHTRHGDLGIEGGQPFYFCEKWYAGSGTGDVSLWKDFLNPISKDLNSAINTGWGRSEWISLCGPSDTALLTASNEYANNQDTKGKIWKLNINTGAKTIICDHGSVDWGNYWNQPHATLSKSGKLAAFASNRSGQTCGYIVGCSP